MSRRAVVGSALCALVALLLCAGCGGPPIKEPTPDRPTMPPTVYWTPDDPPPGR